jgi:hypothetical protein
MCYKIEVLFTMITLLSDIGKVFEQESQDIDFWRHLWKLMTLSRGSLRPTARFGRVVIITYGFESSLNAPSHILILVMYQSSD